MTDTLRLGNVEVRLSAREVLLDGPPVKLGARAFDVLLALAERRDRVVGKNELLELVWPGAVVEENNLQAQVSTLRKLLGAQVIATIPGRGYRFAAALDGREESSPFQRRLNDILTTGTRGQSRQLIAAAEPSAERRDQWRWEGAALDEAGVVGLCYLAAQDGPGVSSA